MRSVSQMDIMLYDANNRCFKKCSSCTRLIAHQSHTIEMEPEQLRTAIRSMDGWYKLGRVHGLIGGEVTLHSRFPELCQVMREEINPGADTKHARAPIGDFNAFATERLFDRRNGRGLWTSLGPKFMEHYEVINDTFSHHNQNDHSAGGYHQALLIHRDDYCKETGTTPEQWEKARDACWLQRMWSATINSAGAYPCEVMASIDQTFYGGKHAWKVEPGWWKREPRDFGDMLKLCDHCSLAQRGPSSVDSRDRDIVSEKNRIALQLVGSPAVKGNRFDPYGPEHLTENRKVDTVDSYTAGPRVAPDNPHVRPKRLSGITVCVGRADHLRLTLPHNLKLLDELIVVTTEDDVETQRVLGENLGATTVISNRCYENDDAFNLGKMQNDGLKRLAPGHDWLLWFTADVFLNPGLMEFVKGHTLNPGVCYGVPRYDADPSQVRNYLKAVNDGQSPAEIRGVRGDAIHDGDRQGRFLFATSEAVGPLANINAEANGYFCCWHPHASALAGYTWPAIMSESFCSAGGVDSNFLQRWPRDKRVIIPELACVHIAHEQNLGDGWNGQRSGWRQCAMICPDTRYIRTEEIPPNLWLSPTGIRFRLTETGRGESVEYTMTGDGFPPELICANGTGGLIFNGRDIGGETHVHVSYYREAK